MIKTLGQHIRELREKEDISLRELARNISISPAFLSDIELGRRHPSSKVLGKISAALKTTKEELEKFDTRPPLDELRRLAETDPAYGVLFRKVLASNEPPQEIIKWFETKEKKRKEQQ